MAPLQGNTIDPESPTLQSAEDGSDSSRDERSPRRSTKHKVRALRGAFPRDELDVLVPGAAPGGPSGPGPGSDSTDISRLTIGYDSKMYCVTEAPLPAHLQPAVARTNIQKDGVSDLVIGLFGKIPRWKAPCVINFAAYANGYPTRDQAVYAATKLNEAAQEWNKYLKPIGISFRWVKNISDAAFVLAYGGDAGGTLARAFFPNQEDLNTLYVYQKAFEPANIRYQFNIFLHELGHVLGLRHEFAPETEGGAIVIGSRNSQSVMSYNFPPQLQNSDKTEIINFYKIRGPTFQGYTVQNFIPDN